MVVHEHFGPECRIFWCFGWWPSVEFVVKARFSTPDFPVTGPGMAGKSGPVTGKSMIGLDK
jgi:hypothetical protein